ncbi:site-specific recombinase XerD [Geomicrobium halophilum]|uniref:Site-specific recombinase XerD n=1 Tax=Geomicrobium halophilum TaxID=549000 RepID=A0A841PYW7_9BACL|nr:tyrosine-type recombinase/integrase [Geomicrobium halophilum]MBB6449475.1 site-specific recombinase XerD [Geomicrobium halophilum]
MFRQQSQKTAPHRYVPFNNKTSKLLRELAAEVEDFEVPHLFTTIYGNKLDKSRFSQKMKEYAQVAGITDATVTPHVLRHTVAVNYLIQDGDIMSLRQILGHTSLSMVQRYTVMAGPHLREQHDKYSPASLI